MCGVEPQVGRGKVAQRPGRELLGLGVRAGAYGADLLPRYPLDAHGGCDPLHLPGAGAGRVHLGHGRHDGPVDALVALEYVLGEEAPRAQLRHPERQRAHARREHALAIAVPAVARGPAELVGLGVHDLVDDGSASCLRTSCRLMEPSSNQGIPVAALIVASAMLPVAVSAFL